MASEQRQYVAYLLRLWQVTSVGGRVWRASLQDVHTGERQGFASVAQLIAFLEAQTRGTPGAADADGRPPKGGEPSESMS
ncbi:MAG: hypothetical protein M3380_01825 [Chloroflexota bacterium]|nr:hypothetical protein [Chloroflexota bacterium]